MDGLILRVPNADEIPLELAEHAAAVDRTGAFPWDSLEALHADGLLALTARGVDVILDDRDERPGVMFADMELIGVPHRVVVSDRGLKEGTLEYQGRRDVAASKIAQAEAVAFIIDKVKGCRGS